MNTIGLTAILSMFALLVICVENGRCQRADGRINEGGNWSGMGRPLIVPPPQLPKNGRFRQVRFSPDGRYILAQDDSSIAVLTVMPFHVLFHRFAEKVSHAGFTQDSQQVWLVSTPPRVVSPEIVFSGSSARVERWRIADQAPVDSKEIDLRACRSSDLSPDSRVLACVDPGGTLRLIDINSGQTMFEKKKFGSTFMIQNDAMATVAILGDPGSASIHFSPDSRFVLVVPIHAEGSTVAWDLRERQQVKLTGGLRKIDRSHNATFVTPDRVLISLYRLGPMTVKATLVRFPSGELLSKPNIPPGQLFPAADPDFVLIHPFGRFARDSDLVQRAAGVEFRTGQVIISDAQSLDVFGNHYVTEQLADGKLGLYERGKALQATAMIDTH